MSTRKRRSRVFGIPCPRHPDEVPTPTYRAWSWLYKTTRVWEHRLGRHDWRERWPLGDAQPHRHCDWCGASERRTA